MSGPYVTTNRVRYLAHQLSDREWSVVVTLRVVRVATSTQLEHLHFRDVTRRQARKVLASMVSRRLLARLPRVVGGVRAGSAGYVYVLDVAGLRMGRPGGARVQRPWSIGNAFLVHSLAVTDLFVQVAEAESRHAVVVQYFRSEPACWRPFLGPGGARVVLKPDAELGLEIDRYEDRWFIELDRATESRSTLARKLTRYVQYWRSGQEQARTGVFPKVLWVVPDAARHAVLVDEFGRTPAEAWPLFAVTTQAEALSRLMAGAGS
jgi:hypothetical protein